MAVARICFVFSLRDVESQEILTAIFMKQAVLEAHIMWSQLRCGCTHRGGRIFPANLPTLFLHMVSNLVAAIVQIWYLTVSEFRKNFSLNENHHVSRSASFPLKA